MYCVCINVIIVFYFLQSDSPTGSRLNLLGWYLLISLFFVFGTVLEFILVLVTKQMVDWVKTQKTIDVAQHQFSLNSAKIHDELQNSQCNVELIETISHTSGIDSSLDQSKLRPMATYPEFFKTLSITSKIDYVSFFVFSVLYMSFNFAYFIFY